MSSAARGITFGQSCSLLLRPRLWLSTTRLKTLLEPPISHSHHFYDADADLHARYRRRCDYRRCDIVLADNVT